MNDNALILFDGVCIFCNRYINLIIKKDKKDIFRFSALQSETTQLLLKEYHLQIPKPETVVLIYKQKTYIKSAAILKIAQLLGGYFKLLLLFYIFPKFIRDLGYDLFAKYRYKLFGKFEQCIVPNNEIKSKFIV